MHAPRTLLLPGWLAACLVMATMAALRAAPEQTTPPRGIWVGQDGLDYCQTASALGPNDIQDLHLRIEGLPLEEEIESALVRREGGGEWAAGKAGGRFTWKAQLAREPKAATADLFLEPSHNDPTFCVDIQLRYGSGNTAQFRVQCGRSNPNLFMPAATLGASWTGQQSSDWTGLGPAVGPDGFADAQLALTGLSTRLEIKSLTLLTPQGMGWEYGLNPNLRSNAELFRDPKDPSRGSLFFSPDRDLRGQPLTPVCHLRDRAQQYEHTPGRRNRSQAHPTHPPGCVV